MRAICIKIKKDGDKTKSASLRNRGVVCCVWRGSDCNIYGQRNAGWFKVPGVFLGPIKSLEIDFSIKGLSSPLIQPMGPFCLSGDPFHCCEFFQSPFVSNISMSKRQATVFWERAVVFLPQCHESRCDCLRQMIHSPCCNQGRPYHFWL